MDPSLVNTASVSATVSPSSYNWAEILSLPMRGTVVLGRRMGGDSLVEESTLTEVSGSFRGNAVGKGKRSDGNSVGNNSSKLVSTCTAKSINDLNELSGKQMIASGYGDDNGGTKNEKLETNGTSSQGKSKPEPHKDYIHVRARRGQATDSHSLAERARREKISERMKILQDLVPGCNKVIGKALVLDEIINYIQSLQQEVEFLSMKLEAVNSRLNPTLGGFSSKDQLEAQTFDANEIMYGLQTPREYATESSIMAGFT